MKKIDSRVWKLIGALALIVLTATVLARTAGKSETLSDYAMEHPEEQIETESETETMSWEKTTETEVTTEPETETVAGLPDEYAESDERITYREGFFYEPIPQHIRDKMKGVSYPLDIDESIICYDDLCYVSLLYNNFEDETVAGEMVCNKAIAQDIVEIFAELYDSGYQIESIRLIDDYDADDTASMAANNTSCFCYRVVDGTTKLSKHALGRAVDINPFYNPYVVYKTGEDDYISPPGSEIYADRTQSFPYKIDENDLAYQLFKAHGFKWGGDWNSTKDYQHFQKAE